jgi:hypothetical protein
VEEPAIIFNRRSIKDDAVALAYGGLALAYVAGDPAGGVALINRALTLNPNTRGTATIRTSATPER